MRGWATAALGAALLAGGCGSATGPQSPASLDQTARDFVSATYAHGVPYEDARALGTVAVPVLLRLLDEPHMAPHRSNIVVTLGMLGTAPAEERLRSFVEAGSGPLPQEEVSLRLDALTALGYAAHVATSDSTTDYLVDGLDLGEWDSRVKWRLPGGGSPHLRLRERTMAALGLSGKPRALQALVSLQAPQGGGRGGGPPALSPSEQALLAESIKANRFIAANGMDQYYRTWGPR